MKRYITYILLFSILAMGFWQLKKFVFYRLDGQFNWSYCVYGTNEDCFRSIESVSSRLGDKKMFIEVRNGFVRDSSQNLIIPPELKHSLVQLASNIEPDGSLFFSYTPFNESQEVAYLTDCPLKNTCGCIIISTMGKSRGFIVSMSSANPSEHVDVKKKFEYNYTNNAQVASDLKANHCYVKLNNSVYFRK